MNDNRPAHWQSHAGPSGWYRIWFPPQWSLEDSGGTARLTSPSGDRTLLLNAFWIARPEKFDLEATADLDELFAKRRNVRRIEPLDMPYSAIGIEGEAWFAPDTPWWKRLAAPRSGWRPWRVWAMQHERVCLIAASIPTGEPDPELQTMAEAILKTVEFAERPADPPEVFAERVLQLARDRFPLLTCEPADDFQLQLGESKVNLFNFYRSYVREPDRFEQIVLPALTTVVRVQEWGDSQTEPPLDEVRGRIMPMLYPETVWRENFPNFVGRPWVAGLAILYVVDENQAYWYIGNELLQQWELSRDELHALALKNLDAYFEETPMEMALAGEDEGPRILMPNRPDAYNTARLLSERFHEDLCRLLGPQSTVGLPNRDFFVAVSLDSDDMLDHVRHQVAEDYARMDHPLTDRLLVVSNDGISEYAPE